ncbi:hypothetical protein GWK47_011409 [Chionoecetes opilio]|uniref:Uncharacterized protein n=1 Tax=Chionoecetes opilio TaxID=41210 RepID=A0A8J5CMI5_CHIOP|nr:hypothetical protein GWK47_011409 [Chionoecetes opilio]
MTAHELQAMEDISIFVALLYATKWNEAMVPQRAPLNDLLFMRDLSRGIPKPGVADVALKAFRRHLWYVSEDLVALSFMDERISNEEKEAMVRNLFRRERKGLKRLDGKKFSPDIDLKDLVTGGPWIAFFLDGRKKWESSWKRVPRHGRLRSPSWT